MENQVAVPAQDNWEPWSPHELASRLSSVSKPWCVVGGWALDLWHGNKTREHDDLEFTILRKDFDTFRQSLGGDMALYTVYDGVLEHLTASQQPKPEIDQVWCFDRSAECWRVDMMIESGTDALWVYKRDNQITRPRVEMVLFTTEGIPYLNPSAVLLFKAKYCREKDEADFAKAVSELSASERLWLRNCLVSQHPEHVWIDRLSPRQ